MSKYYGWLLIGIVAVCISGCDKGARTCVSGNWVDSGYWRKFGDGPTKTIQFNFDCDGYVISRDKPEQK
jgi:hypothetical protein